MDIGVDCFPCILSQIVPLARSASGDETECRALIRRMLRIIAEADPGSTPPDIAAAFHREVRAVSGNNDAFRDEKDRSTALGLQLLPELRALCSEAPDAFESALRLAIGGNIIDYGADPDFDLETAEKRIREVFSLPLAPEPVRRLREAMDQARSVFYILDNCGEAVLDRLLIERYAHKITLGVRGQPILNDVTRREAAMSGLDFVPILDTGDMTPGVSRHGTGEAFLAAMRRADLVIAKGQGNFETLSDYDRPIAFLLRVKCRVIAQLLQSPMHSLQVQLRNFQFGE